MYNAMRSIAIQILLILPIHEQEICLYFLVSIYTLWISNLQFL